MLETQRYGASLQRPASSPVNLAIGSKTRQGQLSIGPNPRDGTPIRLSASYSQDSSNSLEKRRTSSSHQDSSSSSYSGHLGDVSNTSESIQDQHSGGRSLACADTPSPSLPSGFRPRSSTGSRMPTSSNFVSELSSITETEMSMGECYQDSFLFLEMAVSSVKLLNLLLLTEWRQFSNLVIG